MGNTRKVSTSQIETGADPISTDALLRVSNMLILDFAALTQAIGRFYGEIRLFRCDVCLPFEIGIHLLPVAALEMAPPIAGEPLRAKSDAWKPSSKSSWTSKVSDRQWPYARKPAKLRAPRWSRSMSWVLINELAPRSPQFRTFHLRRQRHQPDRTAAARGLRTAPGIHGTHDARGPIGETAPLREAGARKGRKIGHITALGVNPQDAARRAVEARGRLRRS
jgi:hypothetical protein